MTFESLKLNPFCFVGVVVLKDTLNRHDFIVDEHCVECYIDLTINDDIHLDVFEYKNRAVLVLSSTKSCDDVIDVVDDAVRAFSPHINVKKYFRESNRIYNAYKRWYERYYVNDTKPSQSRTVWEDKILKQLLASIKEDALYASDALYGRVVNIEDGSD